MERDPVWGAVFELMDSAMLSLDANNQEMRDSHVRALLKKSQESVPIFVELGEVVGPVHLAVSYLDHALRNPNLDPIDDNQALLYFNFASTTPEFRERQKSLK